MYTDNTIALMKKFYLLTASIFTVLACLILASCNKGDSSSNPFVGTWSCSNHFYGGTAAGGGVDTFVFKSNNTYQWSCTGNWSWKPESGNYKYNEKLGTLTISKNGGGTTVYLVLSISDTFFVIADIESGIDTSSYTYYKQ